MSYKTLAAINVGSGEVSMKIYEISRKTGIREIDYVRYYIELGSDTYTKGYIEYDLVRELCDVLERFSMKMEEYKVEDYLALGSSALIEASNCELIVDQIRVRTGLEVGTIDNCLLYTSVLHRVIAVASGGMDTLPHNGAVITLLAVTGMTHKESYIDIGMNTVIIPLIACVVIIILGSIGIC